MMATGYHAGFTAEIKPGDTVAVLGNGRLAYAMRRDRG
ncbi:hypothetical protein MWLf4_1156 [Limosilactobacillus fermentum]|nr:hypothetical protein MWLf4_1156 [Limosilactobacillus fermentum]